ncbi:hypothetical protein AB835_02680 [Candidatus Endobugula sertula]|uniref:Uncharacterized protein n=1 Tax=Candidatus Endobugula sertula TaxID=62101 RepID=A0A1D2QSZ6_9GAMM|nr:hypothetical protein AB835_02680 [Candidatus Endobugula sertula]
MNYWLILMIVGTIALIVGPVMLFKPSGRDYQLAALRQQAAEKGIRVRLVQSQVRGEEETLAVYSVPFVQASPDRAEWLLLKRGLVHEIHFYREWDWDNKKNIPPPQQQKAIKAIIEHVNDNIVGLELTSSSVGVWWKEVGSKLDDIELVLKELLKLVNT